MPAYWDVSIQYGDKWMDLCRTDYYDDIVTGKCYFDKEDLESVRAEFIEKVWMGARITDKYFAVVDSLTDG